jgi:outer membrane immunogenic protein
VKRTVLVGVVSILALVIAASTGAANAADMPLKAPPAPMPSYNWTGLYIGGNFGGGWSNSDFSGSTVFGGVASTFSGSDNLSGILGGGQIGANYQLPNSWVIGIEADVDWADIDGSTSVCSTAAGFTAGCVHDHVKLEDFGTVRGRLGYAWNNMLLYGTGGWAWGETETRSNLTCVGVLCPGTSTAFTGGGSSASATANGWAAGAGLEWAFTRNWTARLEYLHLQFNGIGESFSSAGTVAGAPFTSTSSSSANAGIDVVRVGVNYIFK